MRLRLSVLAITLGACLYAQALPHSTLETALQHQLENNVQQLAQVEPLFGSVEAVWQFTQHPFKNWNHVHTSYVRTHTEAVRSGTFVFFRLTSGFERTSTHDEPSKLVELTFTSIDGTKVSLYPSYQELKRKWVVSHIQPSSN